MPLSLVEYPTHERWRDRSVVRLHDGLLHYGGLVPSLTEYLDVRAHRYSNREAVVELGGTRLTYRELWTSASRIAGGLQQHGIGYGDRIAIVFPNGVRWVQAFLGALLSGAVPVPVNVALGSAEVERLLADSEPDYVLDDELPDGLPFIDDGACLSELAVLCYTRGIGEPARGVELSNENILSAIETVVHDEQLTCDGIRNLMMLPLAHASGCVNQLLPTFAVGGTVVLDPALDTDLMSTIEREHIDVVTGTTSDYVRKVAQRTGVADAGRVRRISCNGGRFGDAEAAQLRTTFPTAQLWSWSGSTETSGIGLALSDECAQTHPGSAGIACGGMELALYGPDAEVGRGELLCRGPNIMRGYWRDPETTARKFTGNWFHTGDFAEIDGEGFVRMVGPAASVEQATAKPAHSA